MYNGKTEYNRTTLCISANTSNCTNLAVMFNVYFNMGTVFKYLKYKNIKMGMWHTTVFPTYYRKRQKDENFKVTLNYTMSSKLFWDISNSISKAANQTKQILIIISSWTHIPESSYLFLLLP